MIEAWAQHSAESREWIFIYKNGILASVVYRHFKHTRSLVEQDGSFITNRTLDRIVVADLKDGKPTNLDEDMRKDFDDIMQKATATNLKKP